VLVVEVVVCLALLQSQRSQQIPAHYQNKSKDNVRQHQDEEELSQAFFFFGEGFDGSGRE
jgi:hypothetical protein